jgi:glycosyltransferase involved in cell wall biosynthesis
MELLILKINSHSITLGQMPVFKVNEFPLVSVIVPAYNAGEYIGATLESLTWQNYPHLEIIVVDDGSKDQTAEIVTKAKMNDQRIKLLQQPNQGVAAARNRGICQSRGSFIAPVDADDICFPDKIGKLLDCLQKGGKGSGLAYSWSVSIDINGNLIGKGQTCIYEGDVFEYLLFSNFIGNASATLIRKECFDEVGLYNTTYFSKKTQGCEDYDLYLRIAEKYEFKLVKEFLTGYRKTGHSMSDNYKIMEKSRQLVFKDQKIRTPWIPDIVFKWALAYYSLWLSNLAVNRKCYLDSLIYLIRAGLSDSLLIINIEYIKKLLNCLKQSFEYNLLPSCMNNNQKACLQNAKNSNELILIRDLEKISGFNPRRSSLNLLKENRHITAYELIRKARIKNGQLVP